MSYSETKNDAFLNPGFLKLLDLEASLCEGIVSPVSTGLTQNLFGRQIHFSKSQDISFTEGMALSGLRSAAFISADNLKYHFNKIHALKRNNVAISINIIYDKSSFPIAFQPLIQGSDLVQFVSTNLIQAAERCLLVHHFAELSLSPVIHHIVVENDFDDARELPDTRKMINYLGTADDRIPCPTPAQIMLFGKFRRRIPQWYSLDQSIAINAAKTTKDLSYELASKKEFFDVHNVQCIHQSMHRFTEFFGGNDKYLEHTRSKKSDRLLISYGISIRSEAFSAWYQSEKDAPELIEISLLHPLEAVHLSELIRGKKYVMILKPISGDVIADSIKQINPGKTTYLQGNYISGSSSELQDACVNLMQKHPKDDLYFGLEFTRDKSKYPRHQVLLEEINRQYPSLKVKGIKPHSGDESIQSKIDQHGHVVNNFSDFGSPYSSLPRFSGSTSFFSREMREERVADPFQAVPVSPQAASALSSNSSSSLPIPRIDLTKCTACGSCIVECPYTALPSSSNGLEDIIHTGIRLATANGQQVIGLIPLLKYLSQLGHEEAMKHGMDSGVPGLLSNAWIRLKENKNLNGEKLDRLEIEVAALLHALRGFPASVSEILFFDPEGQTNGAGEFFFLSVDPDACTGCGLCVLSCLEGAISTTERTEDLVEQLLSNIQSWKKLPDPSSNTINRLLSSEQYDPFAALMLSRSFYYNLVGGDNIGHEKRQMLHAITSLTDSIMQPRQSQFCSELNALITDLSSNIHNVLTGALPEGNYDGIMKILEGYSGDKLEVDEVLKGLKEGGRVVKLDKKELARKVTLLSSLQKLYDTIIKGPSGIGRSRMGLAIDNSEGNRWMDQYPYNPFTSPVIHLEKEFSPELILGLLTGQIRSLLDNLKLLRKAELEAKNKYVPQIHDQEIASLGISDLREEERAILPPLLLIGSTSLLSSIQSGEFAKVLDSELPVKMIILEEAMDENPPPSLINTIFHKPTIHIFQGNPFYKKALMGNLVNCLSSPLPAIAGIYSPGSTLQPYSLQVMSEMAAQTRSYPSFSFDPRKFNESWQQAISLIPEDGWNEEWSEQELHTDKETVKFKLSWADMAFVHEKWHSHFVLYEEGMGQAIPIVNYIEEGEKPDCVPVIFREKDGEVISWVADTVLLSRTRASLLQWKMLREISGSSTSEPAKLAARIREEIRLEYEEQLKLVKNEFEGKLKEQEKAQLEHLRQKLRDKLVEFAQRKK